MISVAFTNGSSLKGLQSPLKDLKEKLPKLRGEKPEGKKEREREVITLSEPIIFYFKVITTVSAAWCRLIGSRTSALRGFHLSQRSGSEVTLLFHSAASASDSSSHHTNCSSSAGWEGKCATVRQDLFLFCF